MKFWMGVCLVVNLTLAIWYGSDAIHHGASMFDVVWIFLVGAGAMSSVLVGLR